MSWNFQILWPFTRHCHKLIFCCVKVQGQNFVKQIYDAKKKRKFFAILRSWPVSIVSLAAQFHIFFILTSQKLENWPLRNQIRPIFIANTSNIWISKPWFISKNHGITKTCKNSIPFACFSVKTWTICQYKISQICSEYQFLRNPPWTVGDTSD